MFTPIAVFIVFAVAEGGFFLSVDSILLWVIFVVFALFAWIFGRFAWGLLFKIVDEREKTIREQVDFAQQAAVEAKVLLVWYEEMLKEVGREREEILQKVFKEAGQVRGELVGGSSGRCHVPRRGRLGRRRTDVAGCAGADIAVALLAHRGRPPRGGWKVVDDFEEPPAGKEGCA
jgi:hypothetical protein